MFAGSHAALVGTSGNLFARIGDFLRAQGLGPEPINYAFAHNLLSRHDEVARQALARLEDGFRLSRDDIASIGGNVVAGLEMDTGQTAATDLKDGAADRLVEQSRAQVEAVATMMRDMHDETRGFGRDLAERAAAFRVGDRPVSSDEVVRLTHAMISRVTTAETRLEQVAAETDALRAELAEAQVTARRDALTGLPNRRAFDETFAQPNPGGRCLALVDIDRFKLINDTFGHAVGDRVLSAVARILADACDGHLVTRQGGEEFAVLVAGPDIAEATRLLDMAREAVGARRFRARDTDAAIGRVTFSAGVVSVRPGEDAETALARADDLLYRAKGGGRDQVIAG